MLRSRLLQVARRSIVSKTPSFITVSRSLPITHQLPVFNNGVRFYSDVPELTKDVIQERIYEILENFDKVSANSKIENSSSLTKDLGLDSLDLVDIIMALEEEFCIEIPEKDQSQFKTVGDAIEYIANTPDAAWEEETEASFLLVN